MRSSSSSSSSSNLLRGAATGRRHVLAGVRRIVVKVGSNVLTSKTGALDVRRVRHLAEQVSALCDAGKEVIVVSSGAIAAGVGELGLPGRPKTMPELQAAAAVGQGRLIRAYNECFRRHGRHVGQVLLTREDMEDRARFLNTRNTLRALLDLGCVPVINENDSVSVEEIRYGDNDFLAAHLAALILADLVVILSTVDGLLEKGGAGQPRVVGVVERIADAVGLDTGEKSARGTGGMSSKLRAADIVTRAGVPVIIAGGKQPNVLTRALAGEAVGTLFLPAPRRMGSRKRWIGYTARPAGRLIVDDGARRALAERGKSLLASGVRAVHGTFQRGDVVALAVAEALPFARGLTNYSSAELALIQGYHTRDIPARLGRKASDEVIHRDNLVLLG
ncbi:MAG: glutamate 5-kinase [Planctomycetes bacterium]|nr:glutamate 5-kinase [Planctomycetota bacterium]